MGFLNLLMIRITLAVIGGIFYAFLIYLITTFLHVPSELVLLASAFVYLFYLGSRFLLLFSGVDSPYYSRGKKEIPKTSTEQNPFYTTAQWVGKFYHYHDIALFLFLAIVSIIFLISLGVDGLRGNPFGKTIQTLWNALLPIP